MQKNIKIAGHHFLIRLLFSIVSLLLVIGLTNSAAAGTVRAITVSGTTYNIAFSSSTTFANCEAAIRASPWWGNSAMASSFASALGGQLGAPTAGTYGPLFGFGTYSGGTDNAAWNIGGTIAVSNGNGWPSASLAQWAVDQSQIGLSPLCVAASAPPFLAGVAPSSGSTVGGTSVALTGSGFTGATALTIGGVAATSFTVVSDTSITAVTPAHTSGAASVLITTADGTSAANSLFTYTALIPALSPATQTVSGTATAAIIATMALTASSFSGAVTYSIAPTLPAGLSMNSTTGIISGTATVAQSATTYTITGTGATSGTSTATVSIALGTAGQPALTVIASPATLRVGQTSALSTTGGSGSGAVTYTVTTGSCAISGAILTASSGLGSCVVLATKAADSTYTAITGTVTVTINPSIMQALDNTVKGTIMAHASTAHRFAETQLRNVDDHLNQLGGSFSLRSNRIDLGFNDPVLRRLNQFRPILLAMAQDIEPRPDNVMSDSYAPELQGKGVSKNVYTQLELQPVLIAQAQSNESEGQAAPPVSADETRYALWMSGDISRGHVTVDTNDNSFRSDGLTVGVDYRLASRAVIGAAFGFGNDRTKIDGLGTEIKSQQFSLSAYGVYEPVQGWLVDGQLGYGELSVDNQRYSQFNAVILESKRKGSNWFGAVGVSAPISSGHFLFKPYLRINHIESRLNAYSESGDTNALSFDASTVSGSSLFGGILASYDFVQEGGGKLTPMARIEVRHNSGSSIDQTVSFINRPTDSGVLSMVTTPSQIQTMGLGLLYTKKSGVSFVLDLRTSKGGSNYSAQGLRMDVSVPF